MTRNIKIYKGYKYKRFLYTLAAIIAFVCFLTGCKDNPASSSDSLLKITSVEPAKGEVGDRVVIKGSGFSTNASENAIYFNGTLAETKKATSTMLITTVPDGTTSGRIKVVVNSEMVKGPIFTITSEYPGQVYVQNGNTLVFVNRAFVINQAKKSKVINLFFNIYPEEKQIFNTQAPDVVFIKVDPDYSGLAYASGNSITITASYMQNNPKDVDVFTHELMHIVQQYSFGNIPSWLTEGIADYARYIFGINNKAGNWFLPGYSSSQNYTDSYRVTARFLLWLTQNYNKNIVKKLDYHCRKGTYSKTLWNKLTGKSVDALWKEYSRDPEVIPVEGSCCLR